jgi:hypothetical protein
LNHTEIFIVGANGQLRHCSAGAIPGRQFTDKDELDITDKESVHSFDWSGIEYILTPQLILTLTAPKLRKAACRLES